MSTDALDLPNDPAVLKAMIAALQVENEKMSATLRAHDLLVQSLRIRIAKLQKQAFGASSEKIEREIEQLELALEDLQVAIVEARDPALTKTPKKRPRTPLKPINQSPGASPVSRTGPLGNGASSIPAMPARTVGVSYGSSVRTSANYST